MTTTVRHATLNDLDWIVGEFPTFSKHYGTKKPLFQDEDYARRTTADLIENHLVLLAECSERGPMGFIFGLCAPHFYNPNIKTLTELFWWVPASYRKTRAGVMLLNEFTSWGKKNCDWITFGIMDSTEVKESALIKRGYIPYERGYLMEVV